MSKEVDYEEVRACKCQWLVPAGVESMQQAAGLCDININSLGRNERKPGARNQTLFGDKFTRHELVN